VSLFTWAGLAYRNPSYVTTNARASAGVARAMHSFAKANLNCAWCGRTMGLQVHHIHPVSVAPEKASDPANMVMLCGSKCHITVGHLGNYADSFVSNVVEVCTEAAKVRIGEKLEI